MAIKTKQDYQDLYEEMYEHFTDPANRDKFDWKRYYQERHFKENNIRKMNCKHPDLNELWYSIKYVIAATLSRMILENKINKDAFAIRYMKLMFKKDFEMHLPEEIAQIEKLQAERALDNANQAQINFSIGYDDDSNAED